MNSDFPLKESDFTIRTVAKGEGLDYRDVHGAYRFDICFKKGIYYLQVPGYAGPDSGKRELSQQDFDRIIPRIVKELSYQKLFGFFPKHYRVEIVGENV
jgi:hypothetical protein